MSSAALDYERARGALSFIPADDRDTWLKMAMALKSELGDQGFDLWDTWSKQSDRYNERDARDVWRSCKANGGVTAGTLFHEAKARGWRDDGTYQKPSAEELEARRRESAKQIATEDAERARERTQAAKWARAVCAIATSPREPHPYLIRKGLAGVEGLREVHAAKMLEILGYRPQCRGEFLTGRLLVVPIKVGDELSSVELIDEAGRKSALWRGAKTGGYWAAQELPDGDGTGITILIAEGVSTSLSAKEASGYYAVAALSSGNLPAVAKAMRDRYPKAVLGILADLGDGKDKAEEAALATGSALVLPDFGEDRPEGATDLNDMHQHRGIEAVAECVATQMATHAAQEGARRRTAGAKAPGGDEASSGNGAAPGGASGVVEWSEPQPLIVKVAPEAYPLDALPEPIQAAVKEVQGFTKAPMPLVASAALGAVSIATQAHVDVRRAERLSGPSSLSLGVDPPLTLESMS